jgi:hypothetical protein
MLIKTLNSTYEVEGERIRKICGKDSATFTDIGETYTAFEMIKQPTIGRRFIFMLGGRCVHTSYVLGITHDDNYCPGNPSHHWDTLKKLCNTCGVTL